MSLGLHRHANFADADTMNCLVPKESENFITVEDFKGQKNCCGIYRKFNTWKSTKGFWLSKANGKELVANIGIISALNSGFVFGAMTAIDGEKLQEASEFVQYTTWVTLVISFSAFIFSTWETVQYYWFDSMGLNGSGFARIAEYMFYVGFVGELVAIILVVIVLSGDVNHGIVCLITVIAMIPIIVYLHISALRQSIEHTKKIMEANTEAKTEVEEKMSVPTSYPEPNQISTEANNK